jgi:hypothetical protein
MRSLPKHAGMNGRSPSRVSAVAHSQSAAHMWAMLLLILSGLIVVYFTGEAGSRGQVAIVGMGACVVSLLAYMAVSRLETEYYGPRLLILTYGLQFAALTAIATLGLPLSPPYHPFEVNVEDAPLKAVMAMLTVPVGVLLAVALWWLVGHRLRIAAEARPHKDVSRQRRVYLVIAALTQLMYWPAGLENSGLAGYVVRTLAAAWIVAPFLAGRDSHEDRGLAALWMITLLVNAAIGIAAGTRSLALIPAVLFTAGYVTSLSGRRRLAVGALTLVATVPLLQLAGAVGVVRDDLGRGGLELVKGDHVREVFRHLSDAMVSGNGQSTEEVNVQGVSRMLAWANVVVPVMTPEAIPYRGLDGFFGEAVETFRIARLSGLTADDLYDAGLSTAEARTYGFNVSSSTAVEFGLAADAWSRGGPFVAILFSMIAALALMAGESFAYRWQSYGIGVGSILALPVAKTAFFDGIVIHLLPMVRGMVLYMLITALMVIVVEIARRVASGSRPTRGTAARMRAA